MIRKREAFSKGLPRIKILTRALLYYSANYILSVGLHVQMMLVGGFGFLMTFLKRHAFMSLGMTLFIVVLATEWSILLHGCEWIDSIQVRLICKICTVRLPS